MFVMAAHTGARRSELIRCEVDDIDLVSGMMVNRARAGELRLHNSIFGLADSLSVREDA